MVDFLQLQDKAVLVFGVANKKSVAYRSAMVLEQAGARVIYAVRSAQRRESLAKLLDGKPVFVCDVEREAEIEQLRDAVRAEAA